MLSLKTDDILYAVKYFVSDIYINNSFSYRDADVVVTVAAVVFVVGDIYTAAVDRVSSCDKVNIKSNKDEIAVMNLDKIHGLKGNFELNAE
ncbi:Hypothetical predicted protein [Octopus vulgaris]|uniref:Uncharacterized protein n=1 Tax=Octopus vulgaris TaxID=6645 RepID=A0AA36B3M8_OCTVU|nr:Hypothetical predicted protein [Octopus vulgaris]